jgi:hypothetical protein
MEIYGRREAEEAKRNNPGIKPMYDKSDTILRWRFVAMFYHVFCRTIVRNHVIGFFRLSVFLPDQLVSSGDLSNYFLGIL